jgi:hypothetical protein
VFISWMTGSILPIATGEAHMLLNSVF